MATYQLCDVRERFVQLSQQLRELNLPDEINNALTIQAGFLQKLEDLNFPESVMQLTLQAFSCTLDAIEPLITSDFSEDSLLLPYLKLALSGFENNLEHAARSIQSEEEHIDSLIKSHKKISALECRNLTYEEGQKMQSFLNKERNDEKKANKRKLRRN